MRWFSGRREPVAEPEPDLAEPPEVQGPLTAELLADAAKHLPDGVGERVQALARPSLRLSSAAQEDAVARLGGDAMLPAGAPWPTWQGRGLEVVAVLDLARLPALPGLPLPTTGWLTFFYDARDQSAWGFDPAQRDAWRVVYATEAEPRSAPEGTDQLAAVPLTADEDLTAPGLEDVGALFPGISVDEVWDYGQSLPQAEEPTHRIGGWPDLVQSSMWLGAQLASNGIYVGNPTGFADPRAEDLKAGAADWRLLLQIDSDDEGGTMWGDAGRLYFLIRDQDLAAGAFDRCWFGLQCG